MTKPRRRLLAALLMGWVLAASACSDDGGGPSPSSSTTGAAGSSTTSSPTTTTEDPDAPAVRARAALEKYSVVNDRCFFHPAKTPLTCFDNVAVSSERDNLRNALNSAKSAQTRQIGYTKEVWAKQTSIDLTNKPKETPPSIPTVEFDVCYDVSKVNIVDFQGKSIVPSNRKPRSVVKAGVVNYSYPDPDGWRVAYTVSTGKSC